MELIARGWSSNLESSAVALTKLTVADAISNIVNDDSLVSIATVLDDAALLKLMTTSSDLRTRLLNDEVWLARVTVLASLYLGTAHLERGADEAAFHWYARWHRALASAERMARAHVNGDRPYMQMYGTFVDGVFVSSTPLRLPAPYGLVAEVMDYVSRLGKVDAAMDGALLFKGADAHLAASNFSAIHRRVKEARRRGVTLEKHLRKFVVLLETVYVPTSLASASPATTVAAGSSSDAGPYMGELQAHSEARERVLSVVRHRLTRTQQELARAYARIAELEVENLQLRQRIAELEGENRDLKRQVAQLTGVKRTLEKSLDDRPTEEQLKEVRAKLTEERKRVKAAEAKLRPVHLERARLIKHLRLAVARYEEAEAEVERLTPDAELERQLMDLHEAEIARDSAAQVAAAHHSALALIESALESEIEKRGYFTAEQFVERALTQAEAGSLSPNTKKVASVVMAASSKDHMKVTLPPANASGRGRCTTYLKVVNHLKRSDQVVSRELYRRSFELESHLKHTSAGADAEQLTHFIKTNKELVKKSLDGTWLSPPKSPSLHDLVALKNETTGVMYKNIVGFVKDKCGVKFDQGLSEAHVRAAFDDFKFEYDLFHFSEVETKEKETEVTEGGVRKKIIKEIKKTVRGDVLVVKDPVDVIRRSARVHAEAGHVAYPANVPGDVWPISIMIDAGAGITKVALKHVCLKRADSVRAITLLGVLIGAKDTYSAMRKAFGPLYQAISLIMRENQYVSLPWAPRLPTTAKYELNASGPDGRKVLEMVSCDPDEYLM